MREQSPARACISCLGAVASTVIAAAAVLPVTGAEALAASPHTAAGALTRALGGGAEVETPVVTLDPLALRSNDSTPSFSGTASATTPVTIEVFGGSGAEGERVATLSAHGTGAAWVSSHVPAPLEDGTYTAIALQSGTGGGGAGMSKPVTFEIDTKAPTVTLAAPRSPSNDRTPSFSGTASEATPVTIVIYAGAKAEGEPVATAETSAARPRWSSFAPIPTLTGGDHTFTAVARQASVLGNEPGESAPVTFVLDTEAPALTLAAPPVVSNDATPSFSGTTTEAGEVTVQVFAGPTAEGKPVQTVSARASGESWSSPMLEMPLRDGTYTAIAIQESAIGNPAGASAPVTFTVETTAPSVTLAAPLSPSANRRPSFSGTASDHTPVTIEIHSGASATGALVESLTAEAGRGGAWASGMAGEPLGWGVYTAVAIQRSSIHNPDGESPPVTFAVEPIAPAVATEASASVSRSSAALYGSVDPKGAGVSECRFEYGSTSSYGRSVSCGFVSAIGSFPAAGTAAVQVFVRVYGLVPGSTYHFRVLAVGEGGTATGPDQTFTTLPPWLFAEEAHSPAAVSASADAGGSDAEAHIARQLAHAGRAARIAALLASGELAQRISVPGAGAVVVAWYYGSSPTSAARLARATPLVAAGRASFTKAQTGTVTLRVTSVGRSRLRLARHVRVTAICVFIARGGARMRVSVTFELAR